ncbi:MAG: ROK family protein, partial [bacterium]|nr:ROK family protein [bacterium]
MTLLFDIGATKTRMAVARDGLSFGEPLIFETEQEFTKAQTVIGDAMAKLSQGKEFGGAVGGVSGTLDTAKERLQSAPHLAGWVGKDLRTLFSRVSGRIAFENDASVVALGEAVHGAGSGFGVVAYLTVSTGVGGSRIVQGKIDESVVGFEPGHQILDIEENGEVRRLEELISGSAVEKKYGTKPELITDPNIW